MPYILALYFCGFFLLLIHSLFSKSAEVQLIGLISICVAMLAHGMHLIRQSRLRRGDQLRMFSKSVMPYVNVLHDTCRYTNLNK